MLHDKFPMETSHIRVLRANNEWSAAELIAELKTDNAELKGLFVELTVRQNTTRSATHRLVSGVNFGYYQNELGPTGQRYRDDPFKGW